MKPDLIVEINFNIKDQSQSVIRTNANRDGLEEILESWIVAQMGRGATRQPGVERDAYQIVLYLELAEDTFAVKSDTGDDNLTLGIVAAVFGNLERFRVEPLPETYFQKRVETAA
jgi:hypothetical protein